MTKKELKKLTNELKLLYDAFNNVYRVSKWFDVITFEEDRIAFVLALAKLYEAGGYKFKIDKQHGEQYYKRIMDTFNIICEKYEKQLEEAEASYW